MNKMNKNQKIIGHINLRESALRQSTYSRRAKSSYHFKSQSHQITDYITQVGNIGSINLAHSHSLSPKNRLAKQFSRYLLPPKSFNKKTLVLDLDETLVHSGFVPFPCPSDVIIQIELENEIHDIHVLVRPHVQEFLEKMSSHFEIVIFTASLSKYANPLLNIIDQNGYCPFRLFREHCTLINTAFVKDLTRLGRNLKDIIILDNSPVAYALNQYNGFPILSWFDNRNDTELLKIAPILQFLSYVPDVREYIRKFVSGNKIQYDKVTSIMKKYNNTLKNNQLPLSLRTNPSNNRNSFNSRIQSISITSNFIDKQMNSTNEGRPSNENINKTNKTHKQHKKFNSFSLSLNSPVVTKKIQWKGNPISITGIEYINNISSNERKLVNNSPSSTEIYHLKSLPCTYGDFARMNTMRSNSSCKKIIHLITNEKSIRIKSLRNELTCILNNKSKSKEKVITFYTQRCSKQ